MTLPIANARMYAVTGGVEAAWQALLERVAEDAGVPLRYMPYPAPEPLDRLWSRTDLGCVFMCGYPLALGRAAVTPLAAPIPAAPWANGRALYRSDLVVRSDAPFAALSDTFGGRIGWTDAQSHSGFNALRHHLLPYRTPERPRLYAESIGPFVTPRRILDAVLAGAIDIGPLDAYWHLLLRQAEPERLAGIRVLESTATAPIPAFVASAETDRDAVASLRRALTDAASRPWFASLAPTLSIEGFQAVDLPSFKQTLAWDRDARAAGYLHPA